MTRFLLWFVSVSVNAVDWPGGTVCLAVASEATTAVDDGLPGGSFGELISNTAAVPSGAFWLVTTKVPDGVVPGAVPMFATPFQVAVWVNDWPG